MDVLVTLLIYIALYVVAELLRPKPKIESARPAGLGDFQFPTATEGRVVPLIWGTVMAGGMNVTWWGDLRQTAIRKKAKTGLFSSTEFTTGFRYNVGWAGTLCRGQVAGITKVLIGDTPVFEGGPEASVININEPLLFGGDELGNGGVVGTLRIFTGASSQSASTYLATFQSVGSPPQQSTYPGECYVVWEGGYVGNSTTIKPWRFELQRIPNPLGLPDGVRNPNGGKDANLANVVAEVLTNSEWGSGLSLSEINVTNFTIVAQTLATEGNGFSLLLDKTIEVDEFLAELERQMNGIVFQNHNTGLYEIKLARDDYDLGTIPQLNDDNIIELTDFSRGTWNETTNEVRASYNNRANNYSNSFAFAADAANAIIQGGGDFATGLPVTGAPSYPGVKDAELANQIAWRDLRAISYPLAKCTVRVGRQFFSLTPYSVVAVTNTRIGLTQIPMRITRIDYGDGSNHDISLDLIQDVFKFAAGSWTAPPASGWVPPTDTLLAFISTKIFEAPRGIVQRSPSYLGVPRDLLWAGAARRGNEMGFLLYARVSPAAYTQQGSVDGLLVLATLTASLPRGAVTLASITIDCGSAIEKQRFLDAAATATAAEVGQSLLNLILIGSEFLLFESASSGTGNTVVLSAIYRCVLDSVQGSHSAGTSVWALFVGGGLCESPQVPGTSVDVKPLPRSRYATVAEASVTATTIVMANRVRAPIPPSRISLNGTQSATSGISLEGSGSGDTYAVLVGLTRRDYRATDEVQALTTDAASILIDFPAANGTEYQIAVRNDPSGANTLLFTTSWSSSASVSLLRNQILRYTAGVLPSNLSVTIATRHTEEVGVVTAVQSLLWPFSVVTALSGQFNFGALAANAASNVYTATVNGTYNLSLNTALVTGAVEARINGGAWNSVIATGLTTGSIAGVVATNTIEVRHTSSTVGTLTMLQIDAPGAGQDGYAVLYA